MKKNYLLMAAAAAIMLTACSSENDILQEAKQVTVENQAVGFDVYTPAATTTRAGLTGTMTTGRLQRSEADGGGFGVYAFLTEDTNADAGDANATAYASGDGSTAKVPNFMVNEKILWNATNLGWYYNPLKYWPNETDNDSQNTPAAMTGDGTNNHLDRLTFFAYAPYVETGSGATGITDITAKDGTMNSGTAKPKDPTIAWTATTAVATFNPNEGVDLLWGVAPAGGLSYTAVNGRTKSVAEGLPLIDMPKPDVNTSMKFLFQHALARIGVNVVAAIDQVSPGGELDPNTKITINSLKITGAFGTSGELNLNNAGHPGIANWTMIGATPISTTTTTLPNTTSITVTANNATPTNNYIAENLRYTGDHSTLVAQPVVGVTTAKQDLLAPSKKWFNKKAGASTPYTPAKKYFTDAAGTTEAHATYTTSSKGEFYTLSAGVYTAVAAGLAISSPDFPALAVAGYYTITEKNVYSASSYTGDPAPGSTYYTKDSGAGTYTLVASPTWGGSANYYVLEIKPVLATDINFAYTGDIYEAERNYLYVVPTNAALDANFGGVTSSNEQALRTITLQIEYYITTEDSKLNAERAETKNVITKEVVLPSLANGKTYMLNLVLGLTSVKIEAEVDDWKVINVQADLPQNTAE